MTIRTMPGLLMCVFAVGAAFGPTAHAETLNVYPASISLESARDTQRLVAVMQRDDGVTLDVTSQLDVTIQPEGLARWEGGRFVPLSDGEGTIALRFGEQESTIPLHVVNAALDPPLSFRNDIEPVLMKSGCNSGACHGSASGKNGFGLSLFGFDPARDYVSLTREALSRRLDVAVPEESLVLLKSAGYVDHEGGRTLEEGGPLFTTFERWIAEGARDDDGKQPSLTGIEILPQEAVLEGENATQQFVVHALYSDGTDQDVTELAILSSVDSSVTAIGDDGLAVAGRRGEAYLMARFGVFAVVSQVIVVPKAEPTPEPPGSPANYIDEFVYAKHRKLRIAAAGPAPDDVFVRRAYFDILGVPPTVEETRVFLGDTAPDKRALLVDRLLERPEFIDLWAMKWAEVLRVRSSTNLDRKGMYRYNDWLRAAIRDNRPMSELAGDLLTATGGNFTEPAANFYLVETEPTTMAENVAQIFMGIQIKCAQCHNHPFERWTMDDYYSFAAFFAQVGRKTSSDPRETIVYNAGSGDVRNKRDNQVMAPQFLGGGPADVQGRDRRAVLAEWLTSAENPWFAKNIANRVWAHFMGQGIVDPPDDVRVSNPPSNPQLLDELAQRLISYDYDLRRLVRDICTSNTYQMTTKPSPSGTNDRSNFAYARVRRLPSEMLLDAISQVTDTTVKFASLPEGARAVQVADGSSGNYFLEVFGRPARETACTCERRNEPTLAQALHLINGDTVTRALRSDGGRVGASIAREAPTKEALDELYLAALSRLPTEEESVRMQAYIDETPDRRAALEDVYWSVLNSKEFIFNH